jgi:hypothetical protein
MVVPCVIPQDLVQFLLHDAGCRPFPKTFVVTTNWGW